MHDVESKLAGLGLALPAAPAPAANYVPYVISGNHVFISGQISAQVKGRLGEDVTVEQGQQAARDCALALLAQLKAATGGDWAKVRRCVRLGAFVSSAPDFTAQPAVANGASDLMVAALGEAGRHARAAVGVPCLPLGVAVEIDAVFEIA